MRGPTHGRHIMTGPVWIGGMGQNLPLHGAQAMLDSVGCTGMGVVVQHSDTPCEHAGMLSLHDGKSSTFCCVLMVMSGSLDLFGWILHPKLHKLTVPHFMVALMCLSYCTAHSSLLVCPTHNHMITCSQLLAVLWMALISTTLICTNNCHQIHRLPLVTTWHILKVPPPHISNSYFFFLVFCSTLLTILWSLVAWIPPSARLSCPRKQLPSASWQTFV
jgi:hypothetical protein